MAADSVQQVRYRTLNVREDIERASAVTVASGAAGAALAGAAGAIIAIVALSGPMQFSLTAVSALVLATALVAYGLGASARAKRRYHDAGDRLQVLALLGGLASGMLGGAAGGVLAICVLAGASPYELLPAAAIVLGAGVLLLAAAQSTLAWLARRPERRLHRIAERATAASSWALVLAGTGAIVLGSLALMLEEHELALTASAFVALGAALVLAASSLALRYGAQLPDRRDHDRVLEAYAARLLELFRARLQASTTGFMLYEALIAKLQPQEARFQPLIAALQKFAHKELENREYLSAQIDGLGGEVEAASPLAVVEHRVTRGIEELIVESSLTDPLQLLYALHAADMSDAAGWKLLEQVVDQIGHHELKKEVTIRRGDKSEQVRFLGRIIERLARVSEPLDVVPRSAYN
jgi:hypothetical protein